MSNPKGARAAPARAGGDPRIELLGGGLNTKNNIYRDGEQHPYAAIAPAFSEESLAPSFAERCSSRTDSHSCCENIQTASLMAAPSQAGAADG